MGEGGNWLATAGHIRPHQSGTSGNYAGAEAKDTNLDSQGHPKAGEGIITLGIPIPPIPDVLADGRLITISLK